MSRAKKTALIVLGALTAILIVSQLVLGQLILSGPNNIETLKKSHQHLGYLTVVLSLGYVATSLMVLTTIPSRPQS